MTITASLVKELRERTGAGMMECKKALVASEGDIEKAIDDMRKAGQAKADKKASRVAAEGLVSIKIATDNKTATMVEVNSETDFVARDDNFNGFLNMVATRALETKASDVATLTAETVAANDATTIEEARKALIAKIGENINVRRVQTLETTGCLGSYVHGGRIGVVVELEGGDAELAKDIAMHVAASSPLVVSQDEVPADVQQREKDIFVAQAKESGRPDDIIEKMITGRMRKFLDEVSLLGQPFVKDPSQKVADVVKAAGATVKSFTRFQVGEGIEKEEVSFADEVMSQVQAG